VAAAALALGVAWTGEARAQALCVTTDYKTEMVKQACQKGGQPEAKAVMKAFVKEKGIKSCNQCHDKLAPNYELKPDGLEQFAKLGGKTLAPAPRTLVLPTKR
jgi:NAD(P)H-nitrite reductase large subunit